MSRPFVLMTIGTPSDGRLEVSDYLLQRCLARVEHAQHTLVIDTDPEALLSQHYWATTDAQSAHPQTLHWCAQKVAHHPEGDMAWLDCLVADLPKPTVPPLDWLWLGEAWKEPVSPLAERLAFALQRMVKKTYQTVLVNGYSRFLLNTLTPSPHNAGGLQPILVMRPEHLLDLDLEAWGLGVQVAPPAILLTQTGESALPDTVKAWLQQHERCVLMGKWPHLAATPFALDDELETRLSNGLLRLPLGHLS